MFSFNKNKLFICALVVAVSFSVSSAPAYAAKAYDFEANGRVNPTRQSAASTDLSTACIAAVGMPNSSTTPSIISLSTAASSDSAANSDNPSSTVADNLSLQVLDLVNAERDKNGLNRLFWNNNAAKAAEKRASECAIIFQHDRPDGRKFYTVYNDLGISGFTAVGENLAMGQKNAEEVVNDWMSSPTHKANILNPDFTGLGVRILTTDKGIIWVQEFYR